MYYLQNSIYFGKSDIKSRNNQNQGQFHILQGCFIIFKDFSRKNEIQGLFKTNFNFQGLFKAVRTMPGGKIL